MSRPTIKVEMAVTTRPTETPTWTEITSYVLEIHTRRGRSREMDRLEAGTATVVLRDPDRRFDPANPTGPYYPYLKPLRRMRVSADGYFIFAGYVERWPLAWEGGSDNRVNVDLADGFKMLAQVQLNASYPEQRTDERIHAVLNDASWTTGYSWVLGSATDSQLGTSTVLGPVGDRWLDTGASRIQASTLQNTAGLQHLQDVADLERGMLFMGANGSVVFRNRHARARNATPIATFADAATFDALRASHPDKSIHPYLDIVVEFDDSTIINEARIRRQGKEAWWTASDADSKLDYFPRQQVKDYLPLAGESDSEADNAAQALAHYLVRLYKQPQQRVTQMALAPEADPLSRAHLLDAELGLLYEVVRQGATGPVNQMCWLEGIDHDITEDTWLITWRLSAADTTQYFILGDSQYSQLGTKTTLAY